MCQRGGVLRLLPLLDAQARVLRFYIGADLRLRPAVAGQARHQLAVGKDLAGIQRPRLQKLRLRLRQQRHTLRHGLRVRLGGKRHGKFQRAHAALAVRRVEDRHPHGAGDLRLSVPQLPAVEIDPALRVDDAGDVGTVVRHDRLRRLLLRQRQLAARLIGVEAVLFQFQFHFKTILSRPL